MAKNAMTTEKPTEMAYSARKQAQEGAEVGVERPDAVEIGLERPDACGLAAEASGKVAEAAECPDACGLAPEGAEKAGLSAERAEGAEGRALAAEAAEKAAEAAEEAEKPARTKRPIKLSDHFTAGRMLRFALPSIVMMVFTSIYGVVDGLFVSNFVGTDAFASVNLVMPAAMALGAFGYMFGTGGAALVAKTMGEGQEERANRLFTFIAISAFVVGVILCAIGAVALEPFLRLLGAGSSGKEELLSDGILYGGILLVSLPFFIVQNTFQSFFIAAEKPMHGLLVTVAAGVTNIVLDYVLIALMGWGLAGAALATLAGQLLAAIVPLFLFWPRREETPDQLTHSNKRKRQPPYRLTFAQPLPDFRALGKACVNGSSELMTEVAASIVSTLYNFQLMTLVGADGVAAYGVVMYVTFIFVAIFFGFAMGIGPVISYHYGAFNHDEMKGLYRRSMIMTGIAGVVMFALSQVLTVPLVQMFVGYDPSLAAMTEHGFRIYSISFLLAGINIFGSAFFTALNNGKVSAFISFMRSLVFETSTVLVLPAFFGAVGIWFAIIVAESLALLITALMMFLLSKRYHYA